MSIGLSVSLWLTTLVAAAAPPSGGKKLEKYGGTYSCKDQVVKEQVVRALSSSKVGYGSSAITLASAKPKFDGSPVEVKFGRATAVVSNPGTATGPSAVRLVRTGDGPAVDVLMCRYRREAGKAWNKVTASDLVPNGQLRRRLPASSKMVGRRFAPADLEGQSDDFVKVVVAAGVGGKAAPAKVRVLTKGFKRRRRGAAKGGKQAGKRILAEASDPSWKKYRYNQVVPFPEAEGEIDGWEGKKFDCSYFSWLVYERAGVGYTFTNTAGLSKLGNGEFVEVKTPRPGDMVVWNKAIGSKVDHVGIIAEDTSTFWDNSGSESVDVSELSWPVYQDKHIFIRRKGL
ncbi:MAG: NlpC/P60 family protein [Myxococcota bacterium]